MAQIKITGLEGTLSVSNERAAGLAADKKNIPPARQKDMWIEIGNWQGYLSNIKSVILEPEPKTGEEDYNRPLTREEKKNAIATMARVRKGLEEKGILRSLKNEERTV